MLSSNSAWGIEVGAFAIKAVRLEREGDAPVVSDFAFIPHKKVLSTPDLDQNEMIRLGLGQFISQKALEGETLVMSVPGHAAFARFAKLPPVEMKKVPDIVKFEAVQQIPFPIDEVEWDYQTFQQPDSPEVEVGIFAMTRERVQQRLALYAELGISPEALTLSPVAVYNAFAFDHDLEKRDLTIVYLDIGTQSSDLIVARKGQCWIRTFPLGGTHFTEAIANAFKLSYSKAEKLKQEASTSKYAKQIMQAMRPVFTDLLQDIQRSMSYFQSVHREVELNTMVGLGSTFKIPGLRKFLGQQLQMDVVRLDEYRKIRVEGREAASFAENAVNMATAYGLALQGLGLSRIDVNLVPVQVLRDQLWHSKIKWFAAAAAIAIAGGAATFWKPLTEKDHLRGDGPPIVQSTVQKGKNLANQFQDIVSRHNQIGYKAENMRRLLDFRTVWPFVVNDVAAALASTNPQSELLSSDLESIKTVRPGERRLVELLHLNGAYEFVPRENEQGQRFIDVRMRVLLTHDGPVPFLNSTVEKWLRENAEPTGDRANVPYRIVTNGERRININADTMISATTPAAHEEEVRRGSSRQESRERDRRREDNTNNNNRNNQDDGGFTGGGTGESVGEQPPQKPKEDRDRGRGFGAPGGPAFPGGGGSGGQPPFPGGGGSGNQGGGGNNDGGGNRGTGGRDQRGLPLGGGGADTREEEIALDALNQMAPTPERPRVLPPNTTYYETEITFTIELLDASIDNVAERASDQDGSEETASS